jgi:general secretion pathway protein K
MSRPVACRGVAMITALLVVALATTAVISLVSAQQLAVRRTEQVVHGDQAWLYALGVEDWARGTLLRDSRQNKQDGLTDAWAAPLPETRIRGGLVTGRIEDLQGRFNINSLVQQGALHPQAVAQFQRLLLRLGIDAEVANAVLAWLETQRLVGDAQLGRRFLPLVHLSELRQVGPITEPIYRTLQRHLVALPETTPVNLNTATPEVLASLYDSISLDQVQAIRKSLAVKPAATIEQALARPELKGLAVPQEFVSVSSRYFRVVGEAEVSGIRQRLTSHLRRQDNGETRVIYRSRDRYGD